MKRPLFILCCLVFFLGDHALARAFMRAEVQERNLLRCGVSTGIPGFSNVDGSGNWSGLDVDICRGVAAAVLGDAAKVEFIPLLPKERATALLTGEIDILSRNMAWNFTRDSALSLNFAAISFYDLQGFLAVKDNEVKSIFDFKNFSVCLQAGTDYEENLREYVQENNLQYKSVISDTPDQIVKDFEEGRCRVITGGRAQLQGIRSKLSDPAQAFFLPEVIASIPLGPAVRHGDDLWLDIVRWTVFAMINAEELGLSSTNIDSMAESSKESIRRFLGLSGPGGKGLGLHDNWAYQIVKQVGSYGEIFERNLGGSSPLKLQRGLNNLWSNGGIMFAPPLR